MACVDSRGQRAGLTSAGNCLDTPPPPLIPPLFYCVLLCWLMVCCALSLTLYWWLRYVLFNICCDYGRVFRRIYRCSLLTVSTYFVASFDYLLYVTLRLAIVFFSITLYVCSGDGHSAKQKTHAVSSLRVNY